MTDTEAEIIDMLETVASAVVGLASEEWVTRSPLRFHAIQNVERVVARCREMLVHAGAPAEEDST